MGQIWPDGSISFSCKAIYNHCQSCHASIKQPNTLCLQRYFFTARVSFDCSIFSLKQILFDPAINVLLLDLEGDFYYYFF